MSCLSRGCGWCKFKLSLSQIIEIIKSITSRYLLTLVLLCYDHGFTHITLSRVLHFKGLRMSRKKKMRGLATSKQRNFFLPSWVNQTSHWPTRLTSSCSSLALRWVYCSVALNMPSGQVISEVSYSCDSDILVKSDIGDLRLKLLVKSLTLVIVIF